MELKQLFLIIKNEYQMDIRNKSFWISTIAVPILILALGAIIGYMTAESPTVRSSQLGAHNSEEMTASQAAASVMGAFLMIFLLMFGSQIFNKVRKEKQNRIMEVLATCVSGRTMMLAKLISVALIGFTQILAWVLLVILCGSSVMTIFNISIPWEQIMVIENLKFIIWPILFFIGGYIIYGSLYAATGAMTDKNNENQSYMTIITMLLVVSMYIGQFSADEPHNTFIMICSFIPFFSPTVATTIAVGGAPLYLTLLQLATLYIFAGLSVAFAGKIYTATILMRGKKLSLKDIFLFLKMK